MNYLKEYFNQHEELLGEYEVYQKAQKNLQEVEVVSYKDIPEIKDKIDSLINLVQAKECYKNSAEICLGIDGVEYVEGLYSFFIPISHAWNSYKGQHFDLTMEVQNKLNREHKYLGFMSVDSKVLNSYLLRLKYWGCFTRFHYSGEKNTFPLMGI